MASPTNKDKQEQQPSNVRVEQNVKQGSGRQAHEQVGKKNCRRFSHGPAQAMPSYLEGKRKADATICYESLRENKSKNIVEAEPATAVAGVPRKGRIMKLPLE